MVITSTRSAYEFGFGKVFCFQAISATVVMAFTTWLLRMFSEYAAISVKIRLYQRLK